MQPIHLAASLERIVGDNSWRAQLLRSQGTHRREISRTVSGREVLGSSEQALEATVLESPRVSVGAKPRIALLSPYPPDPSGVARFSHSTLRSLGALADVDVFTDALRPLHLPAGARDAGQISPVPYQSSRYDSIVAVLGNSHFHYPIMDLFDRYGRPCILHDSRLTHAYYRKVGEEAFVEIASRFLRRKVDTTEIGPWLEDKVAPTLFVDRVLERASPLVVHTQSYARLLEERYGFHAEVAAFPPNQEFAQEELSQSGRRAARERLGLPAGRVVVSHFGYLADTKGIAACVDSVRWLRHGGGGLDAHLYLVGDATAGEPPGTG